jgi:hypothetical protein
MNEVFLEFDFDWKSEQVGMAEFRILDGHLAAAQCPVHASYSRNLHLCGFFPAFFLPSSELPEPAPKLKLAPNSRIFEKFKFLYPVRAQAATAHHNGSSSVHFTLP